MRFFELLNYQHALGSLLVPIIFMILFGVGLAVVPFVKSKNNKQSGTLHQFNDNISEGNNPFPLVMALIIAGVVIWAVFYILYYGLTEAMI